MIMNIVLHNAMCMMCGSNRCIISSSSAFSCDDVLE